MCDRVCRFHPGRNRHLLHQLLHLPGETGALPRRSICGSRIARPRRGEGTAPAPRETGQRPRLWPDGLDGAGLESARHRVARGFPPTAERIRIARQTIGDLRGKIHVSRAQPRFLFCGGSGNCCGRNAMSPPPNSSLAELARTFGDENVRTLVRTFLRDFPVSIQALTTGNRLDRHRLAHSMKSSSRLMGGHELSRQMAEIEERLTRDANADITPHEFE